MATPLEQLRESRKRLRAALTEVTCDVAHLRRAAAASRARSDRGWIVRGRLRSTVRIACVLTEHAVDAAVELVSRRARQYGWRGLSHAEVTKFVQDMLAAAGDDELAALGNLEAPRDPVALSAAATHVEEWSGGWRSGLPSKIALQALHLRPPLYSGGLRSSVGACPWYSVRLRIAMEWVPLLRGRGLRAGDDDLVVDWQ